MTTVHVLHHGKPLCRFTDKAPEEWPEGHKWVGLDDPGADDDATCPRCHAEAAVLRLEIEDWHTVAVDSNTRLIQQGDRIVGSMVSRDGRWFVEILWCAADIMHCGTTELDALAFIEGVQKTLKAMLVLLYEKDQ